ncbi:MAG TPA: hypothetical protein VLT83_11755 [Opitutaceae bacterium]|nr:hypothetical protein [Opitutaceae bacterium]
MQPPKCPLTRPGSLVVALVLAATLAAAGAQTTGHDHGASTAPQVPPAYPDSDHVANGCHISTITFLARFSADFPVERGEPLVVTARSADGVRRPHTIALISWQGEWWCRDECFGVFTLGWRVEARPDLQQITRRAETILEKHVRTVLRTTVVDPRPAPPPKVMSSEQKARDVELVARMVPFPATIFWVRSGSDELPMVFFRPTDCQIAVYEPLHGTSLAECSSRDDAKIVAAVASRLGYHVDGVQVAPPNRERRQKEAA